MQKTQSTYLYSRKRLTIRTEQGRLIAEWEDTDTEYSENDIKY